MESLLGSLPLTRTPTEVVVSAVEVRRERGTFTLGDPDRLRWVQEVPKVL